MAHDQVDEALGRAATVVSDKSTTTGQVWTSVVTTFASDAGEDPSQESSAPGLTMLKNGDRNTTGSQRRTVGTSGDDLLRLEPKTTITIGAPRPATIIVTPGHTAIVSSVHGSLPTVVATPLEGGQPRSRLQSPE